MKNSNLKIKTILTILLISSLFIGIKSCKDKHERLPASERIYVKKIIVRNDSIKPFVKPNITAVMDDLVYYEVKHPEIVLKQAIWETGWFKSTSCKVDNNLFGFTHDGKNYLKFNTWEESIQYYKKWQDRNYKGGDYYNFLTNLPYAGDSLYTTHLKSIRIDHKRDIQRLSSDTLQSVK